MRVNTALLKEEMEKAGVSLSSLSELSKVDKSTISRLLNGKSCSVFTAQKISSALKLSSKKSGSIFFANEVA